MLQRTLKIVYSQDFIQMQVYPFANIQKGNRNGEIKIMKLFRDFEYVPFTEDFEEFLDEMEFLEGPLELDDVGQLSVLVGTLDNISIPKLPDDNDQ